LKEFFIELQIVKPLPESNILKNINFKFISSTFHLFMYQKVKAQLKIHVHVTKE